MYSPMFPLFPNSMLIPQYYVRVYSKTNYKSWMGNLGKNIKLLNYLSMVQKQTTEELVKLNSCKV